MILVLAYHSVNPNPGDYPYAITPNTFRKQIIFLKKYFTFITCAEFEKILQEKQKMAQRYAVITIDDGYQDNYNYVFPILKELEVPATIFAIAGTVGKNFQNYPMASWEVLKEMEVSRLVDIQSHTFSHPYLPQLKVNDLKIELEHSKTLLEKNLNKEIRYIAYPHGKYNDSVLREVKKNYALAFGDEGLIFDTNIIDRFHIPRFTVSQKVSFWKIRLLPFRIIWILKSLKDQLFH